MVGSGRVRMGKVNHGRCGWIWLGLVRRGKSRQVWQVGVWHGAVSYGMSRQVRLVAVCPDKSRYVKAGMAGFG